ncbi:MAG: DUF4374 domain-containing protein [Bacteroidales bacterium]|nr:DUF4374 domain-containing protein [Bacteroidales bacterium]
MKSKYLMLAFSMSATLLCTTSCDDNDNNSTSKANDYVVCLGVTGSDNVTTYYIVSPESLTEGSISAQGTGIEQNGYHDYTKGGSTIYCIGGMGVTECTGIIRNDDNELEEFGNFVFTDKLSELIKIDNSSALGVEIPNSAKDGSEISFYAIDEKSLSKTSTTTSSIAPISYLDWPSISGSAYNDGYVYISYIPMNSDTYATQYTDSGYVAVYKYPDMTLVNLIKDGRTGNIGTWNAYNGITKDENGDLYLLSSSSIVNGFSQMTKPASFTRIKSGQTDVDADYFFDFASVSNGLRPAHIIYCGNGLAYVEVCTLSDTEQEANRWSDTALKGMIVDLYNQTATDVDGIPVHNGNGGRRFPAFYDGSFVYLTITNSDGSNYIYKIDPTTATATQGAKVEATFVAGIFSL